MVREEEPPRPSVKLSTADTLPSLAAVRGTEPKKLTGLLRNELDWIVMKALEKDRSRRYETANGFAADVQRYLTGEPVLAHPPSTAYRLRKFVRKNRGPVVAGAVVFLALLLGIAGTTVGLLREQEAKQRESERAEGEAKAKDEAVEAKGRAEAATTAERQAKEEEAKQRVKAERAYAKTADVLDVMVSEITGNSLATQKVITPEQKKFLNEVLTYYKEFAVQKGDDQQTRERAASAAAKVGDIEYRLGRLEQAVAARRMACDGFTALAADYPVWARYRNVQAHTHSSLGGILFRLGRQEEAEEEFRKALLLQEKLVADYPDTPGYWDTLATIHHNLALQRGFGSDR